MSECATLLDNFWSYTDQPKAEPHAPQHYSNCSSAAVLDLREPGQFRTMYASQISHTEGLEHEQQEFLTALDHLFEQGQIIQARQVLARVMKNGSVSNAFLKWVTILKQPQVVERRPVTRSSDFRKNMDWVRANRNVVQNTWVALKDGELLDQDTSRPLLHQRLRQQGVLRTTLVVKL